MNCETLVVTEDNFDESVKRMQQGHCGADLRKLSYQRRVAFEKALDKAAFDSTKNLNQRGTGL